MLLAEAEIQQLRRAVASADLASRHVMEAEWGDVVDRREYLYDTPGFGTEGAYLKRQSRVDDRRDGRYRPFFENEHDLAEARGIGRYLYACDETAIGIVDNLTNYTLGTGFTYTAQPKRKTIQPPDGLTEAVQDVIDEITESGWWSRERETVRRCPEDGEAFIRVKRGPGNRPVVRFVEPDVITEPVDIGWANEMAGEWSLNWSFGIGTDPDDVESVYGYHLDHSGNGSDREFVPSSEMAHAKANTPSTVKRGLSDFYAAAHEVEQAAKVTNNVAEGAAIQAAIAWIREHVQGVTQSQVLGVQSASRDSFAIRTNANGVAKSVSHKRYKPGTVLDVPNGQQYKPGPMGSERNQGFSFAVQMVLRRVGQRWSMPEYMVSGDASNANYSSTLVAESPFVKGVEARQVYYDGIFQDVFWKAIYLAWRWGAFARFNLRDFAELKSLIRISVDYPRVSVRNRQEETSIRKTLVDAGIMSPKTWASQEDLDYDEEVAAGAKPAAQPMAFGGLAESSRDSSLLSRLWEGYP